MKRWPRIIILAESDEVARNVRDVVTRQQWIVEEYRQLEAARSAANSTIIGVILVESTPGEEADSWCRWIVEVKQTRPDFAIIIWASGKLPEAKRGEWIVRMMSLGASYVSIPPISEQILEDLLRGFITSQFEARQLKGLPGGQAIDLAEEGQADE